MYGYHGYWLYLLQGTLSDDIDRITWSLILALGVCYQARLQKRDEFREEVAKAFRHPCLLPGGPERIEREISRWVNQSCFGMHWKILENLYFVTVQGHSSSLFRKRRPTYFCRMLFFFSRTRCSRMACRNDTSCLCWWRRSRVGCKSKSTRVLFNDYQSGVRHLPAQVLDVNYT